MATPRKPGDILLEPASRLGLSGEKIDFELGTLFVPENRDEPNSRIIPVGFARFKALAPTGAPPTFHLPGGPGSSLISLETSILHTIRYRPAGDVVLLDQRGASERGEMLKFSHPAKVQPLDQPLSIERFSKAFTEIAHAAVKEYAAKGIDLRGYHVKQCAADVNDLRRALGYEKISLVANSFGSQWSFAIMRLFPEIIARAVLSGVEPLDLSYDMPSLVLAAMRRNWKEAENDKYLQPYLPADGIEAAAKHVLQRLERTPAKVPVKDPKTGESLTITLGHEDFQLDILKKAPDSAAFILSLFHEHYEDWAPAVLKRRLYPEDTKLIGPLIDTALGYTAERERQLRSDPAREFVGEWNWHAYTATKDIWPTADVGDDFRLPKECPIPVLFHHGAWDLQTPMENALGILRFFPNGRILIIHRGEHGTREPVAKNLPDTFEKLLTFLRTGNMDHLPDAVTLPLPTFTVPNFPAPGAKQ